MFIDTTILLVRHAEKPGDPGLDAPEDGPNLTSGPRLDPPERVTRSARVWTARRRNGQPTHGNISPGPRPRRDRPQGGAPNAKAKRELGWQPHYASCRLGYAKGLG